MTPAAAAPASLRAAARDLLCCPDCRGALDDSLRCGRCGNALREQDGIISALPREMCVDAPASRHELEREIAASDGARSINVVQYERAFHDEQADHYDRLFADPLPLASYYDYVVCRQIHPIIAPAGVVVDLCCGTGKSSLPLLRRGVRVIAMDVSVAMLRAYQRKCDAQGLGDILFVHADASKPPLQDGSCGSIMMIGGLHHIPEQSECLHACARALKRGGVLVLHEPLKTGTTHPLAKLLENVYAVTNPIRAFAAVRRRLGFRASAAVARQSSAADCEFTPYERPFHSAQELLDILPPGLSPVQLRSQGLLSFRQFERPLQNGIGRALSSAVVAIDAALAGSDRFRWAGDALFAVLRKSY